MKNSLNSSEMLPDHRLKPTPLKNRFVAWGFAVLGFAGILDAGYLSYEHLQNSTPACSLIKGCDLVLTSSYATLFGIPLSYLGLAFYLSVFTLGLLAIDTNNNRYLYLLSALAAFGFLFSVYLFSLQAFIIKAYCQFCLLSIINSTLIFLLAIYFLIKQGKSAQVNDLAKK